MIAGSSKRLAYPSRMPTKQPVQPNPATTSMWQPQPGPQAAAYASDASVIGYGGGAGGGKSDLILGFAGTKHRRSIIFRRVFPSLRGMIERSREIFSPPDASAHGTYNESLHVWRLNGSRTIELGAVQHEQDKKKYQGQPHDFIGIDEATEFPELIVRFLMAWNRTTVPDQKCRTLLTFNPPMDDESAWVNRFFAPWLDPDHPNPAVDGELRWFAVIDGEEQEFLSAEDVPTGVLSQSRTFFHALLKDNPILEATGYGATIDALPEPLRSLLKGNFDAAQVINPWQVIPSDWIKQAQERWTVQPPQGVSAVGCDVARGGRDQTVISRLHGPWYAPLDVFPGVSTPDGPSVAALLLGDVQAGTPTAIDVIGVGSSAYDSLKDQRSHVVGVNNAAGATDPHGEGYTDRTGKIRFHNLRAFCYWKLREALDPDHGEGIALPPDSLLVQELKAPKWRLTTRGILIEDKDEITARLGRSPDRADAVVLAYYAATCQPPEVRVRWL